MRRAITSSLMLAAALCVGPIHAQTAPPSPAEVERQFDASLNAAEMAGWMKTMAAEPNHVGSPHDKANAEMVLAQFHDWGWDAHIETFEVLYPTPISETLELVGAAAVQGDADGGADSRRRNVRAHQGRTARLCRLSGRRRRHRAARLRQLRHAGRLHASSSAWASRSRARSSSPATARAGAD